MKPTDEEQRTRWTLLARLENVEDNESWTEFCTLYSPLILDVAQKAGLRPEEAEDALQETMKGLHEDIHGLTPGLNPGSFRAWLRKRARWRTLDQIRRRLPVGGGDIGSAVTTGRTSPTDRVPDARVPDVVELCDAAHKQWLIADAFRELQSQVNSKHYRVFYHLIIEERSVGELAAKLGKTQAAIRLIKMRVAAKFRKIYRRLEREDEEQTGLSVG